MAKSSMYVVTSTVVSGSVGNFMERAFTGGKVEQFMMENGRTVCRMERALTRFQVVILMMEIGRRISCVI